VRDKPGDESTKRQPVFHFPRTTLLIENRATG
jgi:hypothetical protein